MHEQGDFVLKPDTQPQDRDTDQNTRNDLAGEMAVPVDSRNTDPEDHDDR